ncbi:hypothetical protein NQ176_g5693 [Zarea fungicola]|uniref:Uncharacterized protein n=1 Tax=Zarea fungicola TaxID=93591 RepID=A0ACC1N8C5_9HYPO|nr:hypothetical protein NQ176_g5693 [Lecanicillium fungicola]
MRSSMIFASVVASSLAVVAADDSLSSFVNAVPKCSLSAFKAALDKQSCDTKNVGPATFDCLCKQVTNISEDMALSVAASELDSDCLANWATSITGICAFWTVTSTSASDYPQATKAFSSELAGATAASASNTTSPTTSGTQSGAKPSSTGAASTGAGVSSNAPGAVNNPFSLFVAAAAFAAMLA